VTRLTLMNSPLLLGFEQLERALDTVTKSAGDGYPPYNIEHLNDRCLRITLAVAGFTPDQLSVEVADRQLIIRGAQDDDEARVYLHRGIAARKFQRKFVLADGIDVSGARLDNGLLTVDLERPEPDGASRQIAIETGPGEGGAR